MSSSAATNKNGSAAVHKNNNSNSSTTITPSLLCPVIYSGSPAIGIAVERADSSAATSTSLTSLHTYLTSLGCELLRIDDSNGADCMHARDQSHDLKYVIYNKQYSQDEMSSAFGANAGSSSAFHSGYDLNTFMKLGSKVWCYFSHDISLSAEAYPNLQFFVEIDQLENSVLEEYRMYVKGLEEKADNRSDGTNKVPPPPPPPPSIPAPTTDTAANSTTTPGSSTVASSSSSSSSPSFTISCWNSLSDDYSSPSTFFYCEPQHLRSSHRLPKICQILQQQNSDLEAMQEVDYDAVQEGVFDTEQHESIYLRRPNHKRDGLLIRWKHSEFELLPLPELSVLDTKFVKGVNMSMEKRTSFRMKTVKEGVVSTLHTPITKKKERSMGTNGSQQKSAGESTDEAESSVTPPTSSSTSSSSSNNKQLHHASRNLMKRQSHILHACDTIEHKLEELEKKLRKAAEGVGMKDRNLFSVSNGSTAASDAAVLPHPPHSSAHHNHHHSTLQQQTAHSYFHSLHFNDLSFLSRSKHNSTSLTYAKYKKENIGLFILLRHKPTGNLLLFVTVHLFWNPLFNDVKVNQTVFLVQQVEEMKKRVEAMYGVGDGQQQQQHLSICIAGDFNSTPSSEVYQLLTQGQAPIVKPSALSGNGNGAAGDNTIISGQLHEVVFANENDENDDPTANGSTIPVSLNTLPRLLLDSSLLKITKWLRAIGIDTVCHTSSTGIHTDSSIIEQFFELARSEGRVIVTQNRSLLKRRNLPPHYHLPTTLRDPLDSFVSICTYFNITWRSDLFYQRCTTCNSLVERVEKEEYITFPFLPESYRTGLNDDGDELYLSRCCNKECARVRWWSSAKHKRTREKLFQVRLDMDVELSAAEQEAEEGGGGEKEKEGKEKKAAVKLQGKRGKLKAEQDKENGDQENEEDMTTESASSTAQPRLPSLPDSFRPHPQSDSEIAAARALRKAAKQSSKADRAQAAAQRKAMQASKVNFALNAEAALLKGDDGEYLFDIKPTTAATTTTPAVACTCHASVSPSVVCRCDLTSTAVAPSSSPSPSEESQDQSTIGVGDSNLLWFTQEKKKHMIELEQRIAEETRKTIQDRKKKRIQEAQAYNAALASSSTSSASSSSSAQPAQLTLPRDTRAQTWSNWIGVEQKMIESTKRRIQNQQQQQQEKVSNGKSGSNNNDHLGLPEKMKPLQRASSSSSDTASTSYSASSSSFPNQLQHYWQSVIDQHNTPDGSLIHTHTLSLASAYTPEPEITNLTPKFLDCIDYLFVSGLERQRVRPTPTRAEVETTQLVGWPTEQWPSDHALLAAIFTFASPSPSSAGSK